MGGDHGHEKLQMPDHKVWKWEGTQLESVQERLARRGLKDPWARNEAWRFVGGFAKQRGALDLLKLGFKPGLAAFLVALAVEYTFFPPQKSHH